MQQVHAQPNTQTASKQSSGVTLSPEQANRLLDKLAGDDAFRSLFESDPAAALAAIGAPVEAATCMQNVKLTSKYAIERARDMLRGQLSATLTQSVFFLNSR